MSSSVEWEGEKALEYVRERALKFVTLACLTVKRRAQELLNVPGTAVSIAKGSKGARVTGAVRSKPGEPPRKQTGELRSRVTDEVDEESLTGRVGSNEPKARALEMGTKRGLLPRPWLRRALAECQTEIENLESKLDE